MLAGEAAVGVPAWGDGSGGLEELALGLDAARAVALSCIDANLAGAGTGKIPLPGSVGLLPGIPGALQQHVLADGDILHLRGDDATLGVVHLGHAGAGGGAARLAEVLEAEMVDALVGEPALAELAGEAAELGGVAALDDPGESGRCKSLADVYRDRRIGVGPGGVINDDGGVLAVDGLAVLDAGLGGRLGDLAHGDAQIGMKLSGDVELA
jgi:hypothetical protein